jgi:50S ribosomal protein L16 3-hydroxylase
MKSRMLGDLTPRLFLRRYWQKQPLFVAGALPEFVAAVDARALTTLAARNDAESRIVERSRGKWETQHGPFKKIAARKANWTLLVSGVNLHVSRVEALLRRFDFMPQARLDDVMVSYATPGGGVGPHVDSYDVFLLQGPGRRRWRVAQKTYVAAPGDLLYVPPGWQHDGVALERCLTYSVGFRAPRGAELAAAFLDWLHRRGLPDAEYRDSQLQPAKSNAKVPGQMIDFADAVLRKIAWSRSDVARFLGEYLTEPKPHVLFSPGKRTPTLKNGEIRLDAKTQLLYRGARFFINGESFVAAKRDTAPLKELAERRRLPASRLARLGGLIRQWQAAGYLRLEK